MDLKKLIKSSPAFVFPAIINLLSLVAFTRMLSMEMYGRLSLALVSVEFLQGILFNWVNMSVMRFFRSEDRSLSVATGLTINLALSLALFTGAALIWGTGWGGAGTEVLVWPLILVGAIGRGISVYVQDVYRLYFTGLKAYTQISVLLNGAFYLPAIVFLFLRPQSTVPDILAVQVLGLLFVLLLLMAIKIRSFRSHFSRPVARSEYRSFFHYGLPLIVSFVAASLFIRIDRYIIQHTDGAEVLGRYSAAFSLSNLVISSFFIALTLPTYPEIIRRFNDGDRVGGQALHQSNGRLIFRISVPLVILACVFSGPLCHLFFGAEKAAGIAPLFPWVVVATFLFNLRVHYFEQLFQFFRKTRIAMFLGLLIGIGYLATGYGLALALGAKGVAIAAILLNCLSIGFIAFYGLKYLQYRFFAVREDRQP